MHHYPTALTIAGSDSGGGAGIQADLKTFLDHRVFGLSAITAVTAQNSKGVHRVDLVPPEGLRAQLDAVFDDFDIRVIKIGMLATAAHADVVAEVLAAQTTRPPIVIDPVMVASTGHALLDDDAIEAVRRLFPWATVITPNHAEASRLAGALDVEAWALVAGCPVLITGGDTAGAEVSDRLIHADGERVWRHPRVGTRPFHGTGCTLASAIAARLALGRNLEAAIDGAVGYVQALIRAAEKLGSIGSGNPSLPHGLD